MKKKYRIIVGLLVILNLFIIFKEIWNTVDKKDYDYSMEKEESIIKLDLSNLLYDINNNYYYVAEIVDSISGELLNTSNVNELKYTIEDEKGTILLDGATNINEKWKILMVMD